MATESNKKRTRYEQCTAEIARNPGSAEAYHARGSLLLDQFIIPAGQQFEHMRDQTLAERMGRDEHRYLYHATADFDQAIRLNSKFMPAYHDRGQCEFWSGRPDALERAIAFWEQAIQVNPEDYACLSRLAWVYATEEDREYRNGERAVELALRAINLKEESEVDDLETLAAAYAEAEDFPQAMLFQQNAIELHAIRVKDRAITFGRFQSVLNELDYEPSETLSKVFEPSTVYEYIEANLYRQWRNYKAGKSYTDEEEKNQAGG